MKRSLHGALLVIAWAAACLPPPCNAAEGLVYSPDEIVAATLEHSRDLQAAGKEVDIAGARRKQSGARGLPSIDVTLSAGKYNGLEDSVLGPEFTIPKVEERYYGSIGIRQPLFTGGEVRNSRRSATHAVTAAKEDYRSTAAGLELHALRSYWGWSKAVYSVSALRASVERMDAHAQDMRNLRDAGMATENDVLSTEVLLDETILRLDDAARQVVVARARITFLTGDELPLEAVPRNPAVPEEVVIPSEPDSIVAALTNRPERAAYAAEARAAKALTRVTKADYYPKVYLTAFYEQGNPNMNFFPLEDEWNDDVFAGVAVTWNIFASGLTRAEVAEAAARAAQAQLMLDRVEESIALEVREARINLQNAISRVKVNRRMKASAKQNLEVATNLWESGLARHSEVLDAHAQLTNAEYELIAASADLLLAQASLAYAQGQLDSTE